MIKGMYSENRLYHNGKEIPLERSLKVCSHSPTGFNWNYNGSGPAQSSLALLLHFGATDEEALEWHQEFKQEVIAQLPPTNFEMQDSVVLDWLESRRIFHREFGDE